MTRRRRTVLWLLAAALLLGGGSAAALTQDRLGGKVRAGDEVVVPAGETVDGDLYASGGSVRIEGTVDGDLVASGGRVEVSGDVTGDLLAGSGSVSVSGSVGGDARVGAGQVTVSGSVGEDLVVGSGRVTVTSSGEVGEDLIFGAGRTRLDGRVAGNVLGVTGDYVRRGTVGGTEQVTIKGRAVEEPPSLGDRLLGALGRFVSLLAVAALLLWLVPRAVEGPAGAVRGRPLASIGVGILTFVGFFVAVPALVLAAVLLAILFGLLGLGGLVAVIVSGALVALAVLAFLFFFALAFVAPAAVGLALGRLVAPDGGARARWGALALGVLVVVVLTSLPAIGGWATFVVALFGLGALLLEGRARRRRAPADVAGPPPPPAAATA